MEGRDDAGLILFTMSSNRLRPHKTDTDTQYFKNMLLCLRRVNLNGGAESPITMDAYDRLLADWAKRPCHKNSRPHTMIKHTQLTVWLARVFGSSIIEQSDLMNVSMFVDNLHPYLVGVSLCLCHDY